MEEIMGEAQRADNDDAQTTTRPVAEFRHGGIKLAVWPNKGENGTIYNTTISNSYKVDKGEWKATSSFSPTDLLVVAELVRQAFAKIAELKQQGPARQHTNARPHTEPTTEAPSARKS
jgi:hypothetical protein